MAWSGVGLSEWAMPMAQRLLFFQSQRAGLMKSWIVSVFFQPLDAISQAVDRVYSSLMRACRLN